MIETIQLTFVRYRDKDDQPTCASNFETKDFCQFYSTKKFGTVELCLFHNEQKLERRDEIGSLIPTKNCPMWTTKWKSND